MIILNLTDVDSLCKKVYVDIYRDGKSCGISGSIDEVCSQMIKRTCCGCGTDGMLKQIFDIYVISSGYGAFLADMLERNGLKVNRIKTKSVDLVLPVIERAYE